MKPHKLIFFAITLWLIYLFSALAHVHASDEIDLQELSVDYIKYLPGSHNLILDGVNSKPNAGLNLNVNLNLLGYLYSNNSVRSLTDDTQYRAVGWEYSLGAHISQVVDLGLYHYSEHTLDSQLPGEFPTMTGIQAKIYLYSKERRFTLF